MKHAQLQLIIYLGIFIAFIELQTVSGKDAPSSAEQLRYEVESALKNQNSRALIALFNWDEIQEKDGVKMLMKMAFNERWKDTNKVTRVKLSPLPAHYKATNEVFSLRTRDNVTVIGIIDIECSDRNFNEHLPYGTKEGSFYIAQTVREIIPGKSLRVTVSIFDPHPSITYTGACTYVKEGKEINFELSGTNRYIEKNLWGDYVKSCTIQKTTTSGLIMLEIAEDHKRIFKSPQIKTEDPISYERH